ncbi:glycoside hydrolase [Salipaludibacillus neizhouensis]|uniref:Glycoside hydrolase n=1 Tax=Salipaludibacillus neizhouensis TaxID=885475 RepID=A0A3A9K0J1_9BACI|nr:glycoside hydrolase family 43 protein [Salipaludibacillus neizhouensis]RKL66247.1 glycoside hydrolase [Salipaludibacillus neizhouensis]
MKKEEIRIRDPFVLPDKEKKLYYLYGTTDENVWDGDGTGFDAFTSADLENWEGPVQVFRPTKEFWATKHFWAPEVYYLNEKYYMFASFKSEDQCRGTQVLISKNPLGPFVPLTNKPVTPENWECLDGTLYIDNHNNPWMIFCHEWIQVQDGEICAIQLSEDLREAVSNPVILFRASEAKWTRGENNNYVTDGPFLIKDSQGQLKMLWSSIGEKGYAIGVARSESGNILGPWVQEAEPLFAESGGHGMLFETFEKDLLLTIHSPNSTPNERPCFFSVVDDNGLKLGKKKE